MPQMALTGGQVASLGMVGQGANRNGRAGHRGPMVRRMVQGVQGGVVDVASEQERHDPEYDHERRVGR